MKRPIRTLRSGFTLMEMLVVISIIAILAGLSFGGFNYVKAKQAREQAKLQVKLLSLALEDYKADNGVFPENGVTDGSNGTEKIYEALYPQDSNAKVYLPELNPNNDPQGWLAGETGPGSLKIYDPWGNEYRYRTNRSGNPRIFASNPDFDLWSVGPDGETQASANGGYDPTDPKNQDDIGW
jgi:prepilin-type N-terminal cleavage/methylation domain-containing protein